MTNCSVHPVASPSRMRSTSISVVRPWVAIKSVSVAPSGQDASSSSARRRVGCRPRRRSRGVGSPVPFVFVSDLRPQPVPRNAGPSGDAVQVPGPPQKTTGLPDTPTKSAPARPGSLARFATALSTSTAPHPHLQATTQSLTATLPYRSNPSPESLRHRHRSPKAQMNPPLILTAS